MGHGHFSITCESLKNLLRLPAETEIVSISLSQRYIDAIDIQVAHSDLPEGNVRVMPTYKTRPSMVFTGWDIIEEEE